MAGYDVKTIGKNCLMYTLKINNSVMFGCCFRLV